ncbi:hypothetical protein [Streptomyces sp. NPDC060205]|uniref:hypothetical protein n=1 Tax=Streptomyces sp. NPDC060205 TaxID=3347072 RepID=UPI003668E26E
MAPSDNGKTRSALPDVFCWTKFGIEAGEETQSIFERKEVERQRNGGVFLWGIGNSIRPSLVALLQETDEPEVIFSPMKSAANKKDIAPERLALWSQAESYDGLPYKIPDHSLVTSRANYGDSRSAHFALVCESPTPISGASCTVDDSYSIRLGELTNLRTGSILGSSQVTSVVRRTSSADSKVSTGSYSVAVRARLVYPYFVRLTVPLPIPDSLRLDRLGMETVDHVMDELLEHRRTATEAMGNGAHQLMLV